MYRDTILETARLRGLDVRSLERRLSGESGAIVFGERIHHREAPQAVAEGRADVAMVYYHLAFRYARIFTGAVRTGLRRMGPCTGDGAPPPGVVVTEYAIARARDTGEWGDAFVSFMRSGDAGAVYERHGLWAAGE